MSRVQLVHYCDWMSALGHTDQELAGGQGPGGSRGKGDRKTSGTSGQEAACGHRRRHALRLVAWCLWPQCLYARVIEEKMRIFITFYLIKRFEVSFDKTKLSEGIFICLC